jgi:hypothetical protein
MARNKQFLQEQIIRAQRAAAAMNTDADRERFEKMAADLRSELDAVEAMEGKPTAAGEPDPPSQEQLHTNEPAGSQPGTGDSNATSPAASTEDDQGPATD